MILQRANGRFFCLLALFFVFSISLAHAQTADIDPPPVPLENDDPVFKSSQWVNRVLVIAGSKDDPLYEEQYALLRVAANGLAQRGVLVARFEGRVIFRLDEFSDFPFRGRRFEEAAERRYLNERLGTKDGAFGLSLVGLDGQVKGNWNRVVRPGELFETIDAMPLRQQEIQEEKKTLWEIRKEKRDARKAERYLGSRDKE